jgi:hypothetical protein
VFNQVTNFAYSRTSLLIGDLLKKQSELESGFFEETKRIDNEAAAMYKENPGKAINHITEYSVNAGNRTVSEWKDLYRFLFVKYVDGNVKEKQPVQAGYKYMVPKVVQPGYSDEWNRTIVKMTGDKFREK